MPFRRDGLVRIHHLKRHVGEKEVPRDGTKSSLHTGVGEVAALRQQGYKRAMLRRCIRPTFTVCSVGHHESSSSATTPSLSLYSRSIGANEYPRDAPAPVGIGVMMTDGPRLLMVFVSRRSSALRLAGISRKCCSDPSILYSAPSTLPASLCASQVWLKGVGTATRHSSSTWPTALFCVLSSLSL